MLARHPALFSLLLGIVSATGFAPFDVWPMTIACLAIWLWLVHAAPGLRAALWRGWLFGLGQFGLTLIWIQNPFTFQDGVPAWTGYGGVLLLAAYLAVYPMIVAGIGWRMRRVGPDIFPDIPFVLVMAGTWIVAEGLRATLLTGYPWNPLAVIWLPALGIAQSVAWVGTYALSGLTVVVAGAALLIARGRWHLSAIVAPVLALLAISGPNAMPPPQASISGPRVLVVQPNLPEEVRPTPDYAERNLQTLLALSGPNIAGVPRLILWPEGALRYLVEDGYPRQYYFQGEAPLTRSRIAAELGPNDIVLTGGNALMFSHDGQLTAVTNSVFAINADGRIAGRYDKAHLVPFGEYLPLRGITSLIGLDKMVQGDVDFIPGPKHAALGLPGFGAVGIDICYEIIFSGQTVDPAQRPALIFNPSNDSWFGDWGPVQHLAQARLRAIEEGLPILRATPSGVSAVIDPKGRLLGTVGLHKSGVIDLPVPRSDPPTLFARYGNRIAILVAVLLIGLAVAIRRRAR
jgi:apolipoprotein N-acyltransferase